MEQEQVTLVDYGVGNIGSVRNMFTRVGADVVIARDQSELACAKRLILPGVGAFDNGMSRLDKLGFRSKLDELVIEKNEILKIENLERLKTESLGARTLKD